MPPMKMSTVASPEPLGPTSIAIRLCSIKADTALGRRSRCGSRRHGAKSGTGLGSTGAMSPMSGSSWRVSAIFV